MKIEAKIDVTKILKEHLFVGQKGKYLDVQLIENKAGRDKYGNDGFVVQRVSKEARESGVKGPILGNWKRRDFAPSAPAEAPATTPTPDGIPYRTPKESDPFADEECPF